MSLIYENKLSGVSIYHALDTHPDKKNFSMHVHSQNEIFLFVSGKASYLVEGKEYSLTPGSMLLIRESESHAINFLEVEPYERYVVNFSSSLPILSSLDPNRRLLSPFYNRPLGVGNLYLPSDLHHSSALSYMKAMCRGNDQYERNTALLAYLLPLLQDISRAFNRKQAEENQQGNDPIVVEIIAHINEHIFEPITVPQIASRFYMSVSQLERVFKRATHSSVWHYITVKRLSAAKVKLESGIPAAIAGEECGFGDYSSFYRAFIKEYGKAPGHI